MFWRGVDFASIGWDEVFRQHAHRDAFSPDTHTAQQNRNAFAGALVVAALAMGAPLVFAALAGLAFAAMGGAH